MRIRIVVTHLPTNKEIASRWFDVTDEEYASIKEMGEGISELSYLKFHPPSGSLLFIPGNVLKESTFAIEENLGRPA